jgi:hypothetical protein
VTVRFSPDRLGNAKADIQVDGIPRITNLDVGAARDYPIAGLNRYRSHTLEVIVRAGTVSVEGLTLSTENRIAVTWNRLGDYQALKALRDIVGGEYYFDNRNRTVYHDPVRGDDLTNLNQLWLREGDNLLSFVPLFDQTVIQNVCYFGGYGEGAFQIGVVVESDAVDESGLTSIERFGRKRFSYTNKECQDSASGALEGLQQANAKALPQRAYTSTVSDAVAALILPGDTCRITHSALGGTRTLRALEVSRSSSGAAATVTWGDRLTTLSPGAQYAALKHKVDQLLRSY